MKVFGAQAWLKDLPHDHQGSNGDCTKYVVIRCKTKKRLGEILDTSPHHLRTYGMVRERPELGDIAVEPETIYYQPEHTRIGYIKGWHKL